MKFGFPLEDRQMFKKLDLNLVFVILAINLVGLINLFSATHGPNSKDVESLFASQIVWLMIGWSTFFIMTIIDYMIMSRIAIAAYLINLTAIIYVSFFGKTALGGQRWIDLGFFHYQPSETMKIALVLLLAKMLCQKSTQGQGLGMRELFLPLLVLLAPFVLIVEQPDLGTALMLASIGGTILFFLKIRRIILVIVGIAVIFSAFGAWKFVLRDYQKNRVLSFLSPTNDPRGTGYNSIQSKIAVGSGKFLGKGFRKGTQSQLEFLPERHTDFIYSVLSEEHGFVGSVLTIGLYCILFLVIIRIASFSRDRFGSLICVGVLAYVFWHMFVNIGMVIGLLPIVGVPLPLLSYGGSSMLTTMAGLGLVSSVAYRRYLF